MWSARNRSRAAPPSLPMSSSSRRAVPFCGVTMPASRLSSVDLPLPLAPVTNTRSVLVSCRLGMSRMTGEDTAQEKRKLESSMIGGVIGLLNARRRNVPGAATQVTWSRVHRETQCTELPEFNVHLVAGVEPFGFHNASEQHKFTGADWVQAVCCARIRQPGQCFQRMPHDQRPRTAPDFNVVDERGTGQLLQVERAPVGHRIAQHAAGIEKVVGN